MQLFRSLTLPGATLVSAWPWLVDHSLLELWLAERVEQREGREAIEMRSGRLIEYWRAVEIVENRRWLGTLRQEGWQTETAVEMALEPRAGGCQVSVWQQGFQGLPLSECLTHWETYRRRWAAALERLAGAVAAS